MKKLLTIFFIFLATLWVVALPVKASELQPGGSAVLTKNFNLEDKRAEILASFLAKYKSPLVPYVNEFIEAADAYGLDWRLVPAITGVESTFGRRIPYQSYNAYGWANGDYKFSSWEESIWHVTKVLKEKYVGRGAVTVAQIGKIYAPPSPFWAGRVEAFMAKIEAGQKMAITL